MVAMNNIWMKIIFILGMILYKEVVYAAFVEPVSETTCAACCPIADANNANAEYTNANCISACSFSKAVTTATTADCTTLGGSSENLEGCEAGRDFRFAGSSYILQSGLIQKCVNNGGSVSVLTLPSPFPITTNSGFVRSSSVCRTCCTNLNDNFDGGNTQPNDFLRADCQSTCDKAANSNPQIDCSTIAGHDGRLGCLLALDMLETAQVHLRNSFYQCNADGTVVRLSSVAPTTSPTKFPTKTPTKFPTKNPTKSPTKNPTKLPTKSPTKAPTKFPTETPTRFPTKNPTKLPTQTPTKFPTKSPVSDPTESPTKSPVADPTDSPTKSPVPDPTHSPTRSPVKDPTDSPTKSPSVSPTEFPTRNGTDGSVTTPQDKKPIPQLFIIIGVVAGVTVLWGILVVFLISRRRSNKRKKSVHRGTSYGRNAVIEMKFPTAEEVSDRNVARFANYQDASLSKRPKSWLKDVFKFVPYNQISEELGHNNNQSVNQQPAGNYSRPSVTSNTYNNDNFDHDEALTYVHSDHGKVSATLEHYNLSRSKNTQEEAEEYNVKHKTPVPTSRMNMLFGPSLPRRKRSATTELSRSKQSAHSKNSKGAKTVLPPGLGLSGKRKASVISPKTKPPPLMGRIHKLAVDDDLEGTDKNIRYNLNTNLDDPDITSQVSKAREKVFEVGPPINEDGVEVSNNYRSGSVLTDFTNLQSASVVAGHIYEQEHNAHRSDTKGSDVDTTDMDISRRPSKVKLRKPAKPESKPKAKFEKIDPEDFF